MAYCTSGQVADLIGTDYDSTNDLTSSEIDTWIARADALIDSACSRIYYPFNGAASSKTDGTDTYLTPKTVQLCSLHLAVGWSLTQLRTMAQNSVLASAAEFHIDQGNVYLNLFRGEGFLLKSELYRNYSLTFGDAGVSWSLNDNEAFISADCLDSGDPPNILEDTVRIGSSTTTARTDVSAAQLQEARLGVEYKVRWDPRYQRYVFTACDERLYSNTTLKVTFNWDYRRDRGRESRLSGVMLSG